MNEFLERARHTLEEGEYACVLLHEDKTFCSRKRGVAPLLELIGEKTDLRCAYAADKVLGAGAAYLYVLMGVSAVWAGTVSESARQIFENYGIELSYGLCVPFIVNRAGDGVCPMEKAVSDATSPEDALLRIKEALAKLSQ